MAKYKKDDKRFRNYMIGMGVIALLLIGGILILSINRPRVLPEALQESTVKTLATDEIGESDTDEYFVYLYRADCYYCKLLQQREIYQEFIKNPGIKMYKISTNYQDPSIGDFNSNFYESYMDEVGANGTPTLIHVKAAKDGKYLIKNYTGVPKIEKILAEKTK